MSRRFHQPDSLEMLLDTMCNTFGGIILIALLVTLLAREQRRSDLAHQLSSESAEIVQRRLVKAQEQLARARAYEADLQTQAANPLLAPRLQLVERRQSLQQQVQALEERRQSAQNQLAATNLQQRREQQRTEQAALARAVVEEQNRLEVLQARVLEVESQLREVMQDQSRRLRLPREHSTSKRPWDVIVRHQRLYPVQFPRSGLRVRNSTSIAWHSAAPDEGEFADPIPGAGWDPASPAFQDFLRQLARDEIYVVFQVYADSFAAFNQAKRTVADQGFDLGWVPLETDKRLKTSSRSQAPPAL
jgi:hypothetical protein